MRCGAHLLGCPYLDKKVSEVAKFRGAKGVHG
jgi:hypothetical protein